MKRVAPLMPSVIMTKVSESATLATKDTHPAEKHLIGLRRSIQLKEEI